LTVSLLPDDVLLEIFVFYLDLDDELHDEDAWYTLAHVCRRWRYLVFASPRRLHLRLYCTNTRPVKRMLDIWPELPIVIYAFCRASRLQGGTNIRAALKQRHRVCKLCIDGIPNSLLNKIATTKLPALTDLELLSEDENVPVLPDSFLGESAPLLQDLWLSGIPFPSVPKLLSSANRLLHLYLRDIPPSGYISPMEIVASLSALTRLKSFCLGFQLPRSQADQPTRRHPLTLIVLPALTWLQFKGESEYLEYIVSQIDAPQLEYAHIRFFNQPVFDTPRLRHFIGRIETFKSAHRANVIFSDDLIHGHVYVKLFRQSGTDDSDHRVLELRFSCIPFDSHLSSVARLYCSALPPLSTLEHLCICNDQRHWHDHSENIQWLEFLRPFTSLKDLVLSTEMARLVAPAMGRLGADSATEVFPALQNIFVEGLQSSGPVQEAIGQFVAVRQLSDHPVAVHDREKVSF
jgi:F-box-like